MRTVSEILHIKGTQFNIIEANVSVLEALNIMKSENHSHLVVFHEGKYAGIFTEKDYARKVILLKKQSRDTPVGDVITAGLPMVNGTDTAERCMKLMNQHQTRYLPVFSGFDFVGVVTVDDLMGEAIANAEKP